MRNYWVLSLDLRFLLTCRQQLIMPTSNSKPMDFQQDQDGNSNTSAYSFLVTLGSKADPHRCRSRITP